mmetsp:Transcript_6650/g.11605  ORF Transcript_6650/g.11605 Transcript_6650/m.11605 type:complete len:376 (+) Transcript_6650:37-1164(+)
MMTPTRRAASKLRHHHFSVSSKNNNNATSTTLSSPAVSPAPTTSSASNIIISSTMPPWLNRWLHLWDQESGTHEILQLKQKVNQSSLAFDNKQRQVSHARTALDRALLSFEESQTQHTQLLHSRDRWTPSQAMEFAKLLEKEMQIRTQLEKAKKDLATLESEQLRHMNNYMNDLRRRYHEEQLWQDKWRIYSTFGTWGLIVLNSIVFFISQYLWRLRESQRMKDVQGLLRQSLMANEGTLRAVQEQSQNRIKNDSQGESMSEQRASTTGVEDAKDVQSNDASEEISTAQTSSRMVADSDEEEENHSQLETAPPSQSRHKHISSYWTSIQQYTHKISKKLLPDKKKVDIPSAILGASMTGMAWLVVVALSSSRKGN